MALGRRQAAQVAARLAQRPQRPLQVAQHLPVEDPRWVYPPAARALIGAEKRLTPADAAKATREAFIDYEIVSGLHRNIRDIIPFAQFTIGQTPRTIRTALERPRVFSPLVASSRRDEQGIVPPWVAEQPHFKLGKDVAGESAFLAGLGTPFEDINQLWAGSLGRTLERGVASTAPPIKALYDGSEQRHIRLEVTFEDGRKGLIEADVRIVDMPAYQPAAPVLKEAAE